MNYDSYETRKGVQPVSWEDFHSLCRGLALAAARFDPQVILGIARGGVYAGALVSHLLRKNFFAVYLTRRSQDQKVSDKPEWRVRPPDLVRGKRVLVVDELSSSGETLRMVKEELVQMSASAVRCAVLYAHSWGSESPDYIGLISDALLINPWDREIVQDGEVILNPEYRLALELQNIIPEEIPSLTIGAIKKPDKEP
jgi:uncharacterized protein